jgi:Xaa-Pro aminopeptidase
VPMRDAYHAARAVFEKAGVAHYFTHGLGHGVGLETNEAPSLNPRSQGILRQGMVVTVEPGLYYPEWGGVRWEYTVLITEDGVRIL